MTPLLLLPLGRLSPRVQHALLSLEGPQPKPAPNGSDWHQTYMDDASVDAMNCSAPPLATGRMAASDGSLIVLPSPAPGEPMRAEREPSPSLRFFCYAVVLPDSYEVDLLRYQLEHRAGIFSCDGFAVFSNQTSLGDGLPVVVPAIPGPMTVPKGTRAVFEIVRRPCSEDKAPRPI